MRLLLLVQIRGALRLLLRLLGRRGLDAADLLPHQQLCHQTQLLLLQPQLLLPAAS